jgi:hypothetical protein
MVAKSAEFEKAITDSKNLPKTLSNDELLEVRPIEIPRFFREGHSIEHC